MNQPETYKILPTILQNSIDHSSNKYLLSSKLIKLHLIIFELSKFLFGLCLFYRGFDRTILLTNYENTEFSP